MKSWLSLSASVCERIFLACWFAISAVLCVLTGGLFSPWMGVLALAPLAASAAGRVSLALEALGLSVLLLVLLSVSGSGQVAENMAAGGEMQAGVSIGLAVLAGLLGLMVPRAQSTETADGAVLRATQAELEKTQAAAEKAQEQIEGINRFYASLGHDLKTPLNAILGFSEVMREEMLGEMPAPYKDYSALINESGQDLLLLVEDILDLSKAEANRQRLEPEPVDLTASGKAVMRQLEGIARRNQIELRIAQSGAVWAEADPRAVRQIWQNLASNAIKYSEAGDVVVLKTAKQADKTLLSVTDTGIGMSEDDLAQIQQPFTRGSNTQGRAGTGLGLTVVSRFAELHGGEIEMESALGRGTRVSVILPAAKEDDLDNFDAAAE